MINPWRKYPRWKPKEDGYYLCSIVPNSEMEASCVTRLYYNSRNNKWINQDRKNVFQGYNVYKVCRAPIQENRVYEDGACDKTEEVKYWKKLPRVKKSKRKIEE